MLNQILQAVGHHPTKQTKRAIIYKSPFNPTERTPSFFVFQNDEGEYKNFKDYSSGAGGDIYKFVMLYYNIGFIEAKAKVKELTGLEPHQQPTTTNNAVKAPPSFSLNQQESYKIVKTQQLQNKALLEYLKERKISQKFSEKYLGEIYYQIDDKKYFALSFLNNSGGREVRNKYFKGSFGKKDISLITPNPKDRRVKIFEGFMDFLSYLTINKNAPLSNYLILNSASMQEKGLKAVQCKFEAFELYLDNDNRGDEATQFFLNNLSNVVDKRVHYKEYKDLNDFLMKGEI